MTNYLVKLLTDDDGTAYDDPKWHFVDIPGGGHATLCTGEYFGVGESSCKFETKTVKRGGITCPDCLNQIKTIKAIKL